MVETTTVDAVRVCVMRVRARQLLRVRTKPVLYTTAADRLCSLTLHICHLDIYRTAFCCMAACTRLIYAGYSLESLRLQEQVESADIEYVILAGSSLFLCEACPCVHLLCVTLM